MKPSVTPSGTPRRERILAFGSEKTGKTTMWLTIAKWYKRMKTPGRFYVLDTDFTVEAMLSGTQYSSLDNVTYVECPDWESVRDATRDFRKLLTPDDWLVVDMATQAWNYAQRYYVEQTFGVDLETYYLLKKKEAEAAGKDRVNQGEIIDWPIVNKIYNPWAVSTISTPGHLFVTASAKEAPRKEDDDLKALYQRASGMRPEAQKHLGHQVHTILYVRTLKPGEPRVTSIGDRERELLNGDVVTDFVRGYLVPVAGWSLK